MLNLHKPKKRAREPDLIPMINVIMLLLCFFLIAGTVTKRDPYEVTAPESRTSSPFRINSFSLLMTKDGILVFEGRKLSMAQLAITLQPHLSRNKEMLLVLKTDAGLPAERLTAAIRALENMGVTNLSLVTMQK